MDHVHIDRIIRSRRKTFSLQVDETGKLIIRAPRNASDVTIREIVARKQSWIEKKLHSVHERNRKKPVQNFRDGDRYPYLGTWYPLSVDHSPAGGMPLLFEEGRFRLDGRQKHRARELMIHWYRDQARRILTERTLHYASLTGLSYGRVNITGAQKRWGSCSTTGNLNFSWRLIMAPREIIEYVVVHELVHLEERNHSNRFWKKVSEIMPEFKDRKKWLDEYGYLFHI
jgi:hypothetical protein